MDAAFSPPMALPALGLLLPVYSPALAAGAAMASATRLTRVTATFFMSAVSSLRTPRICDVAASLVEMHSDDCRLSDTTGDGVELPAPPKGWEPASRSSLAPSWQAT